RPRSIYNHWKFIVQKQVLYQGWGRTWCGTTSTFGLTAWSNGSESGNLATGILDGKSLGMTLIGNWVESSAGGTMTGIPGSTRSMIGLFCRANAGICSSCGFNKNLFHRSCCSQGLSHLAVLSLKLYSWA